MKLDPAIIGGVITGGFLAGNTGEDYDVMPSIAGAAIGGFAASKMNFTLPNGTFDIGTKQTDMNSSARSMKTSKEDFLKELEEKLSTASSNSAHTGNFDPAKPYSTVNTTNLKEAVRYYSNVSESELREALVTMKVGEASFLKLDGSTGELINQYQPVRHGVVANATLEEKSAAMFEHLSELESQNMHPDFVNSNNTYLGRSARVEELTPLLDRLEGNIIFEDGNLKGMLAGQNFSMPLTQTLSDGETLGHISNNNVYTSRKFNIMGEAIATGHTAASTPELAANLGLPRGSLAESTLGIMLNKGGATREATLGLLASSEGVSDAHLLEAIESFSNKTQWDEQATSKYLSLQADASNGGVYDAKHYAFTPYTKSQAQNIDASITLKSTKAKELINNERTVLRNVRTSTAQNEHEAESLKIRRAFKFSGEDRVTGVKADHSLVFTPVDGTQKLSSLFAPNSRNVGTVTNRALSVSTINANDMSPLVNGRARNFEQLKGIFGSGDQFGSAVALRSALFDADTVARPVSAVFGGNITLADGYAMGNKESFANFVHEGFTAVKLKSDVSGQIALMNPRLHDVIEGHETIENLKYQGASKDLFRTQKAETLLSAVDSYINLKESLKTSGFEETMNNLEGLVDKRYKGITDMMDGIAYKGARDNWDIEDIERVQTQGVDDYFARRLQLRNFKGLPEDSYAKEQLEDAHSKILQAYYDYNANGDASTYRQTVKETMEQVEQARRNAKSAGNAVYRRGGQVVGYGIGGEAGRLSKSYDNHELEAVRTRALANGQVTAELIYKGTSAVSNNHVAKTFSVNFKDQNVMIDKDTFKAAGMFMDMFENKLVHGMDSAGNTLVDGHLALDSSLTQSGYHEFMSFDAFKDMLHGGGSSVLNKEGQRKMDLLRAKYNKVDTIADRGGAGFKQSLAILHDIQTGEDSGVISDLVRRTINSYSVQDRSLGYVAAGLQDFVYATSSEKPSLSTLFDSTLRVRDQLNRFQTSYFGGSLKFDDYNKLMTNYLGESLDPNDVLGNMDKITKRMHADEQLLAKAMGSKEGVFALSTDEAARKEIADIFIRNAFITGKNPTDNLTTAIAAINRKAETETGAGTYGKSMSWNAQTQLKANGYSHKELDLFGAFNKAAVNDATALTGMVRKHDTLLNKYFNAQTLDTVRNIMNSAPEERRALMDKAFGHSSGNSVDFYNLNYKPKNGIQSIPLIYDESRGFDSYLDTNNTGQKQTKRINRLLTNIVETDIKLQNATDAESIKTLTSSLDKMHESLERAIMPLIGGSTGAVKASLTREGVASHLAMVGAVNGPMASFMDNEGKNGSYAAVSYEGALDRLKLAGAELTEDEEKEFLQGKGKYLQDIEGHAGLKRIMLDDNLPLFAMLNREPAQGPMSIRLAEYLLDTSIYDSKGARDSVFMKSEDPFYKFLQFGDHDFDSMTEYFVENAKNKSKTELNIVLDKGRQLAKDYSELFEFSKALGVKNNKSNKMASLFDILEQKPNIKTYAEWHDAYLDAIYDDTTRAGLRKTISPKVTMLAAQLNDSLLKSTGDMSSKEIQAGRVLSHYFVENLLKAQHDKSGTATETVAERLSKARELAVNGDKSAYLKELRESLTDQLKFLDADSPHRKLGLDAIEAVVNAEHLYMSADPINSMEIGGAMRGKNLGEALQMFSDMVDGKGQAVPIHKRINVSPDIAEMAKLGYDKSKSAIKQLFNNNKKVLALSAAGLAGVSMAFRENPEESFSQNATADVGRHTLSPNKESISQDATQGQSTSTASEYITPHRDARRAMTVEGKHVRNSANVRENSRKSIFGDNIDSAQVEYRE